MEDHHNIDELERRVVSLEHEARELKQIIMSLKSMPSDNETGLVQPIPKKVNHQSKSKKVVQEKTIDWEKRIGQVWLPRIFIFVLLIGVIWAFKAVSNFGLINEPVRVLLGYLAAFALIFIGQKQIAKKRNALGQVLLGGSVVLLLIVTFAMHVLYGIVGVVPAFILNVIWVLLGIYFAHRYKSQPLAILTGIGGYLIPFLLESTNPNLTNFVAIETVLYLALLIFAMKKKFVILYYVAFAFLHLTFLAGAMLLSHGDVKVFALAVILQHVCLLITLFFSQSFVKPQIGTLFTSFLFTMAWFGAAYPDTEFEIMAFVTFVIYTGFSAYFWNKEKVRLSVTLSIASFALMLFFMTKFEIQNVSGLLIIQGFVSLYLGLLAASKLNQAVGSFVFLVGAFIIIINPFVEFLTIDFINWIILIASLFAFGLLSPYFTSLKEGDRIALKLIVHMITLVFMLYFITLTANAFTIHQSTNIKYMSVSIGWAIYAFISMIIGTKRNDKPLRVFGLVLLFLTLAKLIFVDLSYLSLLIRAVLFIMLGLIGIIISRIYYKNQPNKK